MAVLRGFTMETMDKALPPYPGSSGVSDNLQTGSCVCVVSPKSFGLPLLGYPFLVSHHRGTKQDHKTLGLKEGCVLCQGEENVLPCLGFPGVPPEYILEI